MCTPAEDGGDDVGAVPVAVHVVAVRAIVHLDLPGKGRGVEGLWVMV